MRAMILAAGLGTRLRPLSHQLPKPAMPVRGLPVLAYNLALLAQHGVGEVIINTHHLPEAIRAAAEAHCPPGMELHFSHEPEILDTGGGLRRAADFLCESDPFLLLAGDMLLDLDLTAFLRRHQERGGGISFALLDDPRAEGFGTIGIDAAGRVRRVSSRFDLGGETSAGIYVSVSAISAGALSTLPEREIFSHLDDWAMPLLRSGEVDVWGERFTPEDCFWEPVGTSAEYLAANFRRHSYSFFDADAEARRRGAVLSDETILGARSIQGQGAELERVVVWDDEQVPKGFRAKNGVFAGGRFFPCDLLAEEGA